MKSKIIFRGLELPKNTHHTRSASQSELNISLEETRRMKRPSWIDLSGFKQIKNRRRLSEIQFRRNREVIEFTLELPFIFTFFEHFSYFPRFHKLISN